MPGNPNRMILDRAQRRAFVALDNSDSVAVIDTARDQVVRVIDVNIPFRVSTRTARFTGSHPNSLVLSPDEDVLYVTQGGTNAIAVVPLDQDEDEDGDRGEDKDSREPRFAAVEELAKQIRLDAECFWRACTTGTRLRGRFPRAVLAASRLSSSRWYWRSRSPPWTCGAVALPERLRRRTRRRGGWPRRLPVRPATSPSTSPVPSGDIRARQS